MSKGIIMEKDELIKVAISSAAPFVASINEVFFKPKIKDLMEKFRLKKKNIEHVFENKFNSYLMTSYEKYSIINTIVFNNQQKLLKDLYIPLKVINKDNKIFEIGEYDEKFLPVYERILITDTAGMGKSTILKKIFLSIVEEEIGIPVLVELRRLSKDKNIIDEVAEQLSTISEIADRKFVLELIQKGDFIFLFDGFDEIPIDERSTITKQIQVFANKAGKNKFILTSRPEPALSAFGDFNGFKIMPMKKKEAYNLLGKYDNNGTISKQLISKLDERQYKNIDDFLTNPLLVSLLFAAFEFKQNIPLKKHIFYRQVYDALFESHDLTKGDSFVRDKYCKLDVDDFHRILRHIGYSCLIKGKIEFAKDEILALINDAKKFNPNLNFNESDFLKDLTKTVPLFSIDGIYYKWSHKSLQEYFAAQFIFLDSKDMQSEILLKLSKHNESERFFNLLDLYFDIDYSSFSEVIVKNLLEEFILFIKNTYKQFSGHHKRKRQLLTFGYENIIVKSNSQKYKVFADFEELLSPGVEMTIISKIPKYENELEIVITRGMNYNGKLMNFLSLKNEKYIIEIKEKVEKDNLDDTKLILNKPYLVNDRINSVLNSKENFIRTNQLIIQQSRGYFFVINETEAKSFLKVINLSKIAKTNEKLLNF